MEVYLDHAATTPLDSEVLWEMSEAYGQVFGNPSSIHSFGQAARRQLDLSRRQIASVLGCHTQELIFTSGGTESDQLAILGACRKLQAGHVMIPITEHPAVLSAADALQEFGYQVERIPVNANGLVELDRLESLLRADTRLISVMYVNNETGVIQPIEAIGKLLRDRGVLFHVDAVQAIDYLDKPLHQLPVDMLSLTAHKLNGPKGIGLLYLKDGVAIQPLIQGGAQESRRRAGTENVPAIVALAAAIRLAVSNREKRIIHFNEIREGFISKLKAHLDDEDWRINGSLKNGASHILNISFPFTDSATMIMHLDLAGIAVSGGSACSSGSLKPSHVLEAMSLSDKYLKSAIRFSFGANQLISELDYTTEKIMSLHNRLKGRV